MRHSGRPRSSVAGSFAIAVLLLAGFSRPASAAPSLYDNFSENSQASFWYSISGDSAETLNDTGGLLQFTSTAASTGWGSNYILRETEIKASQNFEVKATWHLAAMSGLQNNQEVDVGLQLMPNTGLTGNDVEIRTRWQNNSGSSASQDFKVEVKSNNGQSDEENWSPSSNMTDGTFYISYNASTDTLYVSLNGYFLPASGNGDWVFPGVVMGQWNASRIVAMLEAEAQQVAVTSGQACFSYFEVTEGTMVTPPTVTGTVNSTVNGAAGAVALTFSGPTPDNNGKTAGSYATPFSVKLDQGFPIFATAPATDGSGDSFVCWEVDGVPSTTDATAQLWLPENHTFTAVYGGAGALFTDSLSGAAIGPWWYQVQQNSAQVYVQEQTQGLELLSNSTATGQIAGLMLRQRRLDLKNSSGFQLQVDWHCTVASGTTELGLMLYGQEGQDENVGICVAYDPTGGAIFGVTGAGANEGGAFLTGSLARTATSGTLYISYDNNNQILYLSKNGYGPFVNNPANGDWSVGSGNGNFYGFNSNYLIVALGGIASGVAISPGSAYLDNFVIKKGWFDAPTTGQVQVTTSLGSTGVPMYFSPADDSGAGNGTTPFYRTVENDVPIYLIAPSTASGDNFVQWEADGSEYSSSAAISPPAFTKSNSNYGALYETTASTVTLSVQSTPATGIAITSSTGDSGTTNYTVSSVPIGTTVNLAAPATAGANSFLYWLVNGSEYSNGTGTSITDSLMSNATCTAVYGPAASGSVTVTLSPAAAATAGALWQEDEDPNTWWSSGATVSLSPGSHVVTFTSLPGWTTPAAQTVTITSGANTPVTGTYTKNTYTLTVQSSPPTGIAITSSTGDGGTANYTVSSIPYGTASVNLAAPATNPTGYTFSQWMVDGKRQPFGQKSITFPMTADATAVALYDTANSYTLDVQSTPPAGIGITSSTGQGGTTEYFVANIASGTSVNVQAPATDPSGYTFSKWTLNGTAQTAGQESITFTMAAGTTAVAQYTLPTYTLTVQSTPMPGLSIGSDTGQGGTTNYTVSVPYGTNVILVAPTNPPGYVFSQWTLNGQGGYGMSQTEIGFMMTATTTAVAEYLPYNLYVQSTPPTGLNIGSSTGDGGTTNYTVSSVAPGTSVNLQAPATDPAGYPFSQWTVNGVAQTAGQNSVTFPAPASFASWASDGANGIAVDSSGNVYVIDTDNDIQRVQKFTSSGATVTQWGSEGSSPGQFLFAEGIALDRAGNVYVADTCNDRIQQFTSAGAYLTEWGSQGSGNGQFDYPEGIAVDSAGNVYVSDSGNNRIQKFTSGGVYLTQWGSLGSGNGQFDNPEGIAVDSAGNIYVADSGNNLIQKFTSAGAYITQWGGYGSGNGQFSYPTGVAVDSAGNVYVTDQDNSRVQKFTSAGAYVLQWGSAGLGNGEFIGAVDGVAVDGNGNVYVTDAGDGLIQVFYLNILAVAQYKSNLSTLTVLSTPATGTAITSDTGDGGTTNYTMSVAHGTTVDLTAPATDPAGDTFLRWTVNGSPKPSAQRAITFTMSADTTATAQYSSYTLTVQSTPLTGLSISSYYGYGGTTNYTVGGLANGANVYLQAPDTDSAGDNFLQWTVNGAAQYPGQNFVTFAMAADTTAVAQYTSYALTVQSVPVTGAVISSDTNDGGTTNYTVPGLANGATVDLTAPATDPSGYVFSEWTVNGAALTAGQKSVTFPAPAIWAAWGSSGSSDGQFSLPVSIAVDSAGNVYVTDAGNNRIQKFTSAGAYVTQWGSEGSGNGQFESPWGIATDSAGNVYVADELNNRIQKFTSSGDYITQWGSSGGGNGQFSAPVGIALDTADNVYVADTSNFRIQKFTSSGDYITQWGSPGGGNGQFNYPGGVAVGSAGNVYVADTYNERIQEFTSAGAYVTQWGSSGPWQVGAPLPFGIAVDSAGNVYVANTNGVSIDMFTSAGVYITQWGSLGSGSGQFEYPYGVAVDSNGNVYVADTDNNRIQIFYQNILAVAQYLANGTLAVQSTPVNGLSIGSSTGQSGMTNYTDSAVAAGTGVNLQAPATDPTGYTFSQWAVNGTAQAAGVKNITFSMPAAATAVAQYTPNLYILSVQSAPPTGVVIASSTGDGGTTNYMGVVAYGTSVSLAAPATDPTGYTFSQWTVNGTDQPSGQKSITFAMTADTTAEAQYTVATYDLTVQATPPAGLSIGSSSGDGGTTNYTVPGITYGTSVNLAAPATDPAGYTFSQWTVNGAAQGAGLKNITFAMPSTAATAVAQYTVNTCALTVQSTPPTGIVISSSSADGGTTNYTVPSVGFGASVDLVAPATDPTGYTFSYWTLNGTAQAAGAKEITPAMPATALTAVAVYTLNTCTLTVQSAPPTGVIIGSSAGDGGTTNYTVASVVYGASVDLAAPATDPTGYTFLYWTLNGTAQAAGAKEIMPTMPATAMTAIAVYAVNSYTLTVQSAPPTGLSISSNTGDGGITTPAGYTDTVAYGTSVDLAAPAIDPTGYTFSYWTMNGTAQAAGVKEITPTMPATAMTAVAVYTLNTYTLTVQSGPPTGLSIGSSAGFSGTTNYTVPSVGYGASVNLVAPAADPAGLYTFTQWTVNGVAQTFGQQSITFAMSADITAVAQYLADTTLTVQSTPPTGLSIGSSTGDGGTTNYTVAGVALGTNVNLTAPATDPSGSYSFAQWTINGVAQTPGQQSMTFAMSAAPIAMAEYTLNTYTLTVQSQNPAGGVSIAISPADNDGLSNGTTGTPPLTRTYNAGTSVTLTAPLAASGNNFQKWQENGSDYSTNPSITVTAGNNTYTAVYLTPTAGYMLAVQSAPPIGLSIGSCTGHSGTTNCSMPCVGNGTCVNLVAPATDPAGYTFSQWMVNGAAQAPGQKSVTFTVDGAVTAMAQYTANIGYTLSVQSSPPVKQVISSSTGNGGTTNYTKSGVAYGASVNLQAPATDPAGYAFSQWTVNGAAQPLGQKAITFTMDGAVTAVAQYTLSGYALTVESTPQTGLSIGSSTGQKGMTNYYINKGVGNGTSVNLQAPAIDPKGYVFSQWAVNGVPQTAGQKSITFTMDGDTTAVAQYTLSGYALTVQSTPPTGLSIASSTGQNGTTNYMAPGSGYGTSVNLQAPATDPAGYTFSQWTVNGAAQAGGQKSITFTMDAPVTAVAHYTANIGYALSVQSTPPVKQVIGSSTGHGGTTSYTKSGVAYGTNVSLQAPAADPAGYTFSQWMVNGAAQTAGQKSVAFTMDAAVTAVAEYNIEYTLTVESTPPTGLSIGSSTGQGGTTNCTIPGIAYGTSVNLEAPAADPAGYTFSQWTVNGAAQPDGQKSITVTMDAAVTAVARYTANIVYTLSVQSTPPTGLSIGSSTGQSGTTNYTNSGVAYGTNVNLEAPATDPAGYTFSQWTLNGAAQPDGQKSITFTIDAAVTAVAKYTPNTGYTLTVQSTPPGKQVITSSTFDGGITNYTVAGVAYGASVNLAAPVTDPIGYTFSQWTVNGAAQPDGQKSVTFTMDGAVTAVAEYTPNTGYTLTVQSTPPGKQVISSSTGQNGTTNYTTVGVGNGASVNLQAPATDPAGYTFSQWTVNGAAQTPGQKSVTFAMNGAVTAVAEYTANVGYALTVESTPPPGLAVSSSTGQNGTTNYTKAGVGNGTTVNLQAPATDPAGYTFSQWTVNGAAQPAGEKSITFTMDGAMTAVAQYILNGYALTVESTPPTGLSIGSSSGQQGATNYYKNVANGASVNLQAPATDPAGYVFSQWSVNGAAQTAGQKSITFTVSGDMIAVAQYTLKGYTLTVQSTPPTGLSIGSSTGQGGTTNCTIPGIASGTSVNLEAPATDPAGYTFSQWTLNGAAQPDGQKSITITMDAAVTAVAHYTANISYTLTVQSTPPSKQVISSSTGNSGTTSYANTVAYGTTVDLEAPATDPAGYTFSQWTVNGAAQADGQKSITFTMDAAVTAVAEYTANIGYALSVQSTPPTGQIITSSTFHGGITNYTVAGVAYGTSVNLQAPATDPSGYTFSQWTVNGAAQSPGQKSITFAMNAAVAAVAHYTANVGYTLTVESTPAVKLVISSSTGHGGTTNYAKTGVAYGTSVNLQAPATDPAGYTFSQWTVNGAAQSPGQKSVTFTMDAAVTAVAKYTANISYTLTVQSTAAVKQVISSSTGHGGTTNYTKAGVAYGTSVNLQAPATDPAGYMFSQWTVSGVAQPAGQKSVAFTITAATSAMAVYVKDAP